MLFFIIEYIVSFLFLKPFFKHTLYIQVIHPITILQPKRLQNLLALFPEEQKPLKISLSDVEYQYVLYFYRQLIVKTSKSYRQNKLIQGMLLEFIFAGFIMFQPNSIKQSISAELILLIYLSEAKAIVIHGSDLREM